MMQNAYEFMSVFDIYYNNKKLNKNRYIYPSISIPGCDISLLSPTGNFTSPGYPSKYLANKQCRYSISVPVGKTIQLDFISFNLGKLGCVYAELKVYEGTSASGTPVLTKCGTSRDSFVSDGSQLYIVFKATLMTTPGFQIRYAARDGKFLFPG